MSNAFYKYEFEWENILLNLTRAANQPYGSTVHIDKAEFAVPNPAQRQRDLHTAQVIMDQKRMQLELDEENWLRRGAEAVRRGFTDGSRELMEDFHRSTLGGYVTGAAKEEANVLLQAADYLTGETGLEPQFTITSDERLGADVASVGMFAVPVAGALRASKAGFFDEPYTRLDPERIRFSQATVSYLKQRPGEEPYTLDDIMGSMGAEGWKDDYIDVVKMPEDSYSTLDNSRVLSARRAGIKVNARVHRYNQRLPKSMEGRFRHPAFNDVFAETWGEALEYRIMRQNMSFMTEHYPLGTYDEPRVNYPKDYPGMIP